MPAPSYLDPPITTLHKAIRFICSAITKVITLQLKQRHDRILKIIWYICNKIAVLLQVKWLLALEKPFSWMKYQQVLTAQQLFK